MDFSTMNHRRFIGSSISQLPTPAMILSEPILQRNIQKVLDDVENAGVGFRPHVKTLKVGAPSSVADYC